MVVPWNDREAVERARAEHAAGRHPRPSRCPANMGLVPPGRRLPRASCAQRPTRSGALLVFDEVISGFRVARGGAQEREGVTPDLTVLGKVIGGGLPGRRLRRPRAS